MTFFSHALPISLAIRALENGSTYRSRGWKKNLFIIVVVGIVGAFFSHFLGDMIPHWDPNFKWQEVGMPIYLARKFGPDLVLLGFLLIGHSKKIGWWKIQCLFQSWTALMAGFISMIPDAINTFWTVFWPETPKYRAFTYFHSWCHTDVHPQEWWGMVFPIIITFLSASTLTLLAKQPNFWTNTKTFFYKRWKKEQVSES